MKKFFWFKMFALAVGFALGLYLAWVVSPIRNTDTTPDTLRADFKDEYRSAIAAAYGATHNLERAKARMALLGDLDPTRALTAQAQRMLAAGDSIDNIREVANLAGDLQTGNSNLHPATPDQESVTQSITSSLPPIGSTTQTLPTPAVSSTSSIASSPEGIATNASQAFDTPTVRPTRTPMPTTGPPYQLAGQEIVCKPNLTDGLMQIVVFDNLHHLVPGVEIIISYSGSEEHFFTGLKPELGDGYADYIMQPGVTYSLRVGQTGIPVPNLSAPTCPDTNGQTYSGGLKLTFQQQ